MQTKEKIRFALALAFSCIFVFLSVLIIDAAIAEFFMMPSKMTETFYGFALFAVMMAALALLLIGIGTVCTGALGAFFAYSFWNFPKASVRRAMKTVLLADVALLVLDLLFLMLLLI